MIVVADTSPLLNLAAVDKLSLLKLLYSEIVIPPAVSEELCRNGIRPDLSFMRVVTADDRNMVTVLQDQLDPGEAEAIAVALELHADLLLVDEKRGRRLATAHGLEITGLLGVLAEAKSRGLLVECRSVLDDIIKVAGFWISRDLRTRYLRSLNEYE